MLQIFAIILFSNSLILLLLFSQFSAIILIILRLKELSFVILQHERTKTLDGAKSTCITGWRAGPARPTHPGAPRVSPITSIYTCYYSRIMLYAKAVLLFSKLFLHNYRGSPTTAYRPHETKRIFLSCGLIMHNLGPHPHSLTFRT